MGGLDTDSSLAIIPAAALKSGGPPAQGIPALGFSGSFNGSVNSSPEPQFVIISEASEWLEPREPVIAVEAGSGVKAYLLQVLTWHEIANDTVAGIPVAVTFSRCATAPSPMTGAFPWPWRSASRCWPKTRKPG